MKKLIAVAVLASFSSLPYAAEKDITTDVVVVGQGAAGRALKSSALKRKAWSVERVTSPKVFSL